MRTRSEVALQNLAWLQNTRLHESIKYLYENRVCDHAWFLAEGSYTCGQRQIQSETCPVPGQGRRNAICCCSGKNSLSIRAHIAWKMKVLILLQSLPISNSRLACFTTTHLVLIFRFSWGSCRPKTKLHHSWGAWQLWGVRVAKVESYLLWKRLKNFGRAATSEFEEQASQVRISSPATGFYILQSFWYL